MLAYYVGPPDARRRIRESAKTEDEQVARRRLEKRAPGGALLRPATPPAVRFGGVTPSGAVV
jgi:hypothetical protein